MKSCSCMVYMYGIMFMWWAIRLSTFQWQHEKHVWDFLQPGLVSILPFVSKFRELINKISKNASYFCVTKHFYNWMGAMTEDSNTCTSLKYINRHQVNSIIFLLLKQGWGFHF